MNNTMNAPKILPWIARKAGITDELALKLWRRAASETEYLTGKSSGSEYWGLAVERFLGIVEDEVGGTSGYSLTPAPRLSWPGSLSTAPSAVRLRRRDCRRATRSPWPKQNESRSIR